MKHKIILLLFLSYFIFAQSSYHLFEVKRIEKKNAQMSLTGGITDGFYIVSMGLGTPPQTVHLALDTGSSNLALVSQGCKYNGQPCLANNTYMTDKSSTINKDTCHNLTDCGSCKNSTQLQCTLSLTYADNTHVEGVVMSDYIHFSNFSSQIYFGAITNDFNGNFASNKTDGVLGLAYGSIDENNLPSFLLQITENLKLRDMFSICMGYRGGSFLLGGVDPDYHVGDIMYTPIIKQGYYTVQMNMIQIANYEDSLIINTNKYDTYIDSGTSQIIVPKIIYNQIVTKFRNLCKDNVLKPFLCDEGNIFDISPDKCTHFDRNVFAKLPDLKFQFRGISDGSVFEVSINPRNFFIYVNSPGSGFDFCGQFGIAAVDGIDQIILGDTFMRSFYLVFDRENKIIGISYSKNCGGNIPSTASNPLTYLGIGLSLGVVILGASSMFLIIYVKTKRERYQQLQLQNINL